ncbi:MAG: hypothetical protein OXE57_17585 [Alphaproteobacteria bacterium]|nr:hypothetical protein [Alphaproteobacteria bacterium]
MTATDPRPQLAAALQERFAPAAEALAAACAEDMNPDAPPLDDRDRAEHHRAGRAQLAHLRQLLAVLDWSARHRPEPAPDPGEDDHDGSADEFHYLGKIWTGRQDTPEFYAWAERQDRREERRRKREKRKKRKKKTLAAETGGAGEKQGVAAGLHDET